MNYILRLISGRLAFAIGGLSIYMFLIRYLRYRRLYALKKLDPVNDTFLLMR